MFKEIVFVCFYLSPHSPLNHRLKTELSFSDSQRLLLSPYPCSQLPLTPCCPETESWQQETMWEKNTGFSFKPPFLRRSLYLISVCWYMRFLMTSCWCLLHTISPSSLCVLLLLFISVSLYLQDQSDKSKSDDDWGGREDVVDRTYTQKDFYYCCSGSFFVRLLCILSPPASPAWKCLIIDKLQQYQYHICLYFCFKDNYVVYFLTLVFWRFQL